MATAGGQGSHCFPHLADLQWLLGDGRYKIEELHYDTHKEFIRVFIKLFGTAGARKWRVASVQAERERERGGGGGRQESPAVLHLPN